MSVARSEMASRMIWLTNLTTDASGSSASRSIASKRSSPASRLRPVGLEDFLERLRAHAVERLDRAQQLRPRHQHPLDLLARQQLRRQPPRRAVEDIVGRQPQALFPLAQRQDLVLENEPARQDAEARAVHLRQVQRLDRRIEEPAQFRGKALLVHLAGVEDVDGPGVAIGRRRLPACRLPRDLRSRWR